MLCASIDKYQTLQNLFYFQTHASLPSPTNSFRCERWSNLITCSLLLVPLSTHSVKHEAGSRKLRSKRKEKRKIEKQRRKNRVNLKCQSLEEKYKNRMGVSETKEKGKWEGESKRDVVECLTFMARWYAETLMCSIHCFMQIWYWFSMSKCRRKWD